MNQGFAKGYPTKDTDTATALDYYFANKVSGLGILRQMGKATDELVMGARDEFIMGLELTIQKLREGKIFVIQGIGESELQEMLNVARYEDWKDPDTIRKLYLQHSRLTGAVYDEKLFAGMK